MVSALLCRKVCKQKVLLLPEPSLLLDGTILDARLPFRHAVLEIALHWIREISQITIAETVLLILS